MSKAPAKAEGAEGEAAPAKGGKKKMIIIIVAVLVLAIAVGDVNRQVGAITAVVLELSRQCDFPRLSEARQGNGAGEACSCNDLFHGNVLLIVWSRA